MGEKKNKFHFSFNISVVLELFGNIFVVIFMVVERNLLEPTHFLVEIYAKSMYIMVY